MEKKETSNSFSATYKPGWNPQVNCGDEAGYLGIKRIFAEDAAREISRKEARKRRRALRLKAKRARRYYAEKKLRMAANGPGRHPTLALRESAAVQEAASLA